MKATFRVGAATLGVMVVMASSLVGLTNPAGATTPARSCPPFCGKVAAGDPLLIPYMTVNPGLEWYSLPANDVQSYEARLARSLEKAQPDGVLTNVAAARWHWFDNKYYLLVVLVASSSLRSLHLAVPAQGAQDICSASGGVPGSGLSAVPGVPDSVGGLCVLPRGSPFKAASVEAFRRANVAALLEIASSTRAPASPAVADTAVQQAFLSLPAGGVYISDDGVDVPLVVVWAAIGLAVVLGVGVVVRRRRSWRVVLAGCAGALGRRRLALAVSVLAVVGAMAFSMVDTTVLHGVGGWWMEAGYNDFWRAWSNAADMTYSGGYGHVFGLDTALETTPAWLVVIAPVARLAFGLSFPYPGAVTYPGAFLVAGPLFLAAVALPLCAADRWMQFLGVTELRRRALVLGAMAVTLPPMALFGHPEDIIALGSMLYGLLAALEGRRWAAGWWLGVALAFQFLAFLAVPLALLLLGRQRRWPLALLPMVGVPLAVLAVPLVADPSATIGSIVHQKVYQDLGFISPTWNLDPGVGAFIRVAVALVAVPAAVVVWRRLPDDRGSRADLLVWSLGVLFALRVFEPELVPYFLAPALSLAPLSACRAPWWRLGSVCALAVWTNWWLHDPVDARWWAWLVLIALLGALAWLGYPRRAAAATPEAGHRSERAGLGAPGRRVPLPAASPT